MNTTSQESGKQGDGRSTTGTGAAMGHQGGQTSSTGSMGSQSGSTGSTGSQSSPRGMQGSSTGMRSGTQTGGQMGYGSGQSEAEQHAEGTVAKTIEQQTAKLPSDLFLWAAGASIGVSAIFEFMGNKDKSRFIGQWVAPFLLLGVYNKLVKTQGSDRTGRNESGAFNRSSGQSYAGQQSGQW